MNHLSQIDFEKSSFKESGIQYCPLGLISYDKWQAVLVKALRYFERYPNHPGFVFYLQHPQVITLGKHADQKNVLSAGSVPVVRTDRGGQVTGHEPGQLVVYPVLNLGVIRLRARQLVCILESAVIDTLGHWQITAERSSVYPGVWVGDAKICAVGLRIKQRISYHGIAINVENDLKVFQRIVPCAIADRGVTSLRHLIKERCPSIRDFQEILLGNLDRLIADHCEPLKND